MIRPTVGTGTATTTARPGIPAARPAPFPVLSGSWPAADEAVFDIRPAQHLDSMPIAGLDERDTALEIQGTEPGDRRVKQQVDLVVGQRCAPMANRDSPVERLRMSAMLGIFCGVAKRVEAAAEHPPAGQAGLERRRGDRLYLGATSTAMMVPNADPGPHDVHRHIIERPAVDEQVPVRVDRREDAGQRPGWPAPRATGPPVRG